MPLRAIGVMCFPSYSPFGYAIEDHPHLVTGPMLKVFEAFRTEVLALNPCVTEEFLKLYVAYKAETNFVDVIPQMKRLSVLVSTTSFTRPALRPHGFHLGGDFLLGHRFAGLSADSVQHVAKVGGGLAAAQLNGNQPTHGCRIEQAVGPRLVQQRVGQIQLDGDAHGKRPVVGYRTDTPRRIAHTAQGRLLSLEPRNNMTHCDASRQPATNRDAGAREWNGDGEQIGSPRTGA